MKTMNPGEVALGEQMGLGVQPVLHIVPGQGTLVHIAEVCPSRDLV